MNNETKVLGGILIGSIILIVGAVFMLSRNQAAVEETDQGLVYQINYSKGEKLGTDSAKVKLVEFSDFQCPACGSAEPDVHKVRESTASGNFQFIYRHYPLPQHLNAKPASNLAIYAASKGKFWQIHDRLFATQKDWENLPDPTDFFVGIAKEFGLNEVEARDSIKTQKYADIIQSEITDGNSYNVNSTPTFYLNGRKLNVKSFDDIQTEVDKELAK